jgi:NAD(P)-dependent dehydrogenase (short-subunit alcohol dehydrogenase family)
VQELAGKIAVVTGAASGIGRALALRFASEGMAVALADVEEAPLRQVETEVAAAGAETLAALVDVSSRPAMLNFASAVRERFGPPHVLCNNAGVSGGGGPIWATTENDWSWVLGVNLMGVVHGCQAFLPDMLAAGHEGHVVNTSSVLGLSTGGGGIYGVTKHAVTRLSEGLWYDLKAANAAIGVSVLCPGMIATNIIKAERNRPSHLVDGTPARANGSGMSQAMHERFQADGRAPAEVAGMVVDAIRSGCFYVLTHDSVLRQVEARMRAILDGTDPPPATPLTATPRRSS